MQVRERREASKVERTSKKKQGEARTNGVRNKRKRPRSEKINERERRKVRTKEW